ncbi:type II CRISPR RNA-guided endonuclease Cas9 [Jannaschia sp. S6380]|uniref:type II CRISPR RNA-guided endonuclease Cas9 n=1 Tax=Jannaschia sp. S6380 TaxID=2926408 RepID=UPI001FF17FE4|nr:type II CRISPR RNA-guided endonuclease Cas9 [Jannaschia sp. S6380]MCK0167273.1 type II CRISPR RNA-guided endonuclease Cas9 [Jannaschia sp. S6380]
MRLGLDIGTNSIGWWLYGSENGRIARVLNGGVRIFSDGRDPKSKASKAVDRRAARAMRRRRDRYLRRRASLMRKLAEAGLMPRDPAEAKALDALDPYALRAQALDQALPLHHLGRALFHLNQRRGFKSNRKTDRGDNESGLIKDASARLDWAIREAGARTYGEFLHERRERADDPRRVPTVRTRLSVAARDGAEEASAGYDFYPDRRHLEDEFDAIWEVQAASAPERLTPELRDALRETIFYQRSLKAPKVGLCFLTGEKRIAKAHPLTQRRVLYEIVNALRVVVDGEAERGLTREERDRAIHMLDNRKEVKGPAKVTLKALAKELKLPKGARFTLATATRDAIACDPVRAAMGHSTRLGGLWSGLDAEAQWDVVQRVRAVETEAQFAALVDWLIDRFGVDRERAVATANAPLPEGYARLGLRATKDILVALEEDVITYDKAVAACGMHHSDGRTGEVLERLPYYGEVLDRHVIPGSGDPADDPVERYGRITNPTVHIGLGQLRRLVNRIIEVHGKPDEIVVELARDLKLSEKQKDEANKRSNANRANAERRSAQLQELGQADTGANRLLLRLWEDLGPAVGPRCCPYTGETISVGMLFDGSCDIDHILPYSRTLDDGFANRTVCLREANREKRNRTPWETWGGSARWDAIEGNLKNLPENKRWRFAPDAMERFEGERDFLDRALVDTQYLSRLARTYLETLYDGEDGRRHVWVVPGRMTEMLRRHWGLNFDLGVSEDGTGKSKDRTDHRHHAIDAAVIAATDRSLLQTIQKAAGRDEGDGQGADRVARDTPDPWDGFREDVRARLDRIVVSHRVDHGIGRDARPRGGGATVGALHEATALGIVDENYVTTRIPLLSLKPSHLVEGGRGDMVRDPYLRTLLAAAVDGKTGKAFEQALIDFAAVNGPYRGIRSVRILKTLQERARVSVPSLSPIKAYQGGSNHRFEIWRLPDGKVVSQVVTAWEVHNLSDEKKPHPAAKRLLSVHRGDMVKLHRDGVDVTGTVQKSDVANGLFIVPHNEANADNRTNDKDDPFRWIQISARPAILAGIRRVHVDEMGRVRDPGPPC